MSNHIKRTALVIGATGLVGSHLTHQLLRHNTVYKTVRVFVRRDLSARFLDQATATTALTGVQLEQVKLNFDDMHSVDSHYFAGDDVYCCLGTTIKKAGSQEAFYKVDYTYVNTFAQLCHQNGARQFILVTAVGANENSYFFYNQVKGKIENAVKEIGYDHVRIIRPSLLLGERGVEHRCMEDMAKKVMGALSFMTPARYKGIEGEQVAKAMIEIATGGSFDNQAVTIHENDELLRY